MSKYLSLLLLLLSLHVYNVKSEIPFYSEPTIFSEHDDFFLHTVERGQTVYSISKIYQVSIASIYKLNPGSENSIAAGSVLKIPQISGSYFYHTILPKETLYSLSKLYYTNGEDIIEANPGLSVETFTIGKTIRIPVNKVTKPAEGKNEKETNSLLNEPNKGEKLKTVTVALLLPFDTNDQDFAKKRRFVEYYEGFLLALDSLKRTGTSVTLQVYNTGEDTKELARILKTPQILEANMLIGGFSDDQIKLISNFSRLKNILYIIPFTSKSDEPLYNPLVFQINTPHSYLYSKVAKVFCDKYEGYDVMFVNDSKNKDKEEFIQVLQKELKANQYNFKTVTYGSEFTTELKNSIKKNPELVVIPTDASSETLTKIITPLQSVAQAQKSKNVALFGYPEWQRLGHEFLDKFFLTNTSIYSVFYTNGSSPEVKYFSNLYKKWYSKSMLDTYPRYSILGFDTGMYFIKAMTQYGESGIYTNINKVNYKGIQTNFEFKRVSNWGGFINTNVYMINFNPDYSITKDSQKLND